MKLRLRRTFITNSLYWLGLARWWIALHIMPRKTRNQIMYYFEFWRETKAVLRGAVFDRIERGAKFAVREDGKRHG